VCVLLVPCLGLSKPTCFTAVTPTLTKDPYKSRAFIVISADVRSNGILLVVRENFIYEPRSCFVALCVALRARDTDRKSNCAIFIIKIMKVKPLGVAVTYSSKAVK